MTELLQTVRPAPVPARTAPGPTPSTTPATPAFAPSAFAPSAVAPVLAEGGRPLPDPARAEMETAFGQDLSDVRVHDDAASARAAADLDARAFTVGSHIGFADGGFRPQTPEGRGLLAHEIAHVLQGGAADHGAAEAEARDAVARLATGERTTVARRPGLPRVHRAPRGAAAPPAVPPQTSASAPGPAGAPAAGSAAPTTTGTPAVRLPPGLTVISDVPSGVGTTELIVRMAQFTLPLEKGAGPWVQEAYDAAASGGRLVFSPVIEGNRVAAYKEEADSVYRSIWPNKYGFPNTAAVANAFTASTDPAVRQSLADAAVRSTVTGLRSGYAQAHCDVDHIVEKQMGGTSIPSNLQLLVSNKNQASGRQTYQALVEVVNAIRAEDMRGSGVRRIQIRIGSARVPTGTSDPSFVIEDHLRAGRVVGSAAVQAQAQGKPVNLQAGGMGETVSVRDTGETPLDSMSRRIVPGMKLLSYRRGRGGAGSTQDNVQAELDSRALRSTGPGSAVALHARPAPAGGGAPAASPQPPATGAPPDPTTPAPGETRILQLDSSTRTSVRFYYPYLSPGELTSISLDDQGNVSGTGVIRPTIPIFRTLAVTYSRDSLALAAPLDKTKLRSPFPAGFRFTGGQLALQLSPEFVPSGNVTFSIGPESRPVLLGDLTVRLAGGVLVATGTLTPAGRIPGITAASGQVEWSSETGWSGKVMATTSSIPNTTANVELGFRMRGEQFQPYATGGLVTQVRNTQLRLTAAWNGITMSYAGGVTVDRPLPMVERVVLNGRYGSNGLFLEGDAPIKWRNIDSNIHLEYNRREDEQEGRFSGRATFTIRTAKAEGSLLLAYDDAGRITGRGTIAYQVTPNIRPLLGIELTRDQRIKMFGEVRLGDIPLTRMWPAPNGGQISIIRGVGVKFSIPTPVPAVTAFGEIRGSLGLGYGVGPIMLRGVVFSGELYPLEDDPQVRAKLKGAFVVPAYAELYGTFGAYIGLEVALGAVGAKGGVEITPRLRISAEAGINIEADYDSGGFSFAAEAYASGQLTASATVDLVADLYAAYGLLSHRWTYQAASVSAQLGPTVRLTIGRIAYSKSGEITWPSLSQIRMEPENIDPLEVVREMLHRGDARET